MTLIVNVLHKDFTLLAADKLANAAGPATITMGRLTINLPNGGSVTGLFPKVITAANGCAAAGSAGVIAEHTYVDAFKATTTPEDALAAIRNAAQDFFDFAERDQYLEGKGQMINESIVSFFDVAKSAFWTFIIKYTRFESHQFVYARNKNPKAYVFSTGSGNATLHEKVPEEEMQQFIDSIADEWSESQLVQWLDKIFRIVSENNKTVGATYDSMIATRDNPVFRSLASESHGSGASA